MIKAKELSDPVSCLNKANDDERLFVLMARDECAPEAIRYWTRKRIEAGKNRAGDAEIIEALRCADKMDEERAGINKQSDKTESGKRYFRYAGIIWEGEGDDRKQVSDETILNALNAPTTSGEMQEKLFMFLKHGDSEHEDWLSESISAFFNNEPRPEPRQSSGEASELAKGELRSRVQQAFDQFNYNQELSEHHPGSIGPVLDLVRDLVIALPSNESVSIPEWAKQEAIIALEAQLIVAKALDLGQMKDTEHAISIFKTALERGEQTKPDSL